MLVSGGKIGHMAKIKRFFLKVTMVLKKERIIIPLCLNFLIFFSFHNLSALLFVCCVF
jgi:hypothetical protein